MFKFLIFICDSITPVFNALVLGNNPHISVADSSRREPFAQGSAGWREAQFQAAGWVQLCSTFLSC